MDTRTLKIGSDRDIYSQMLIIHKKRYYSATINPMPILSADVRRFRKMAPGAGALSDDAIASAMIARKRLRIHGEAMQFRWIEKEYPQACAEVNQFFMLPTNVAAFYRGLLSWELANKATSRIQGLSMEKISLSRNALNNRLIMNFRKLFPMDWNHKDWARIVWTLIIRFFTDLPAEKEAQLLGDKKGVDYRLLRYGLMIHAITTHEDYYAMVCRAFLEAMG